MSTEKLIELVYRYPQLYDRSHKDFRKNQCKQRLWKTVARQLGSRNGEQIKRKWKNLRDTYCRFLRVSSEEGPGSKRWIWSERMEIFRPFLTLAPNSAELAGPEPGRQSPDSATESDDNEHEDAATHDAESRPGCSPAPPQHEMITCDLQVTGEPTAMPKLETDRLAFYEHPIPPADEGCLVSSAAKRRAVSEPQGPVIAYLESRPGADELDSLFLAYAMTVKKFSPRRQVMAKLKIAQLIAEEELAHLDETELSATQSYNHSALP